jgi:hypothetical protein
MITNTFRTHDNKYLVRSFGNGWAYEVHCGDESLWFQDHDAEQLQDETEDFTNTMVLDMYFEMIGA